jgi:SAM-dependent methyltransferase
MSPHQQLRKCDLCGSISHVPVVKGEDLLLGTQGHFQYVKCSKCGLVFLEPQPSSRDILARYPAIYYGSWKDNLSYSQLVILDKLTIGRSLPRSKSGPALDVGTGSGSFLGILQGLGMAVYGVEPFTEGYLAAKRRGLNVFHGTLFEAKFPNEYFHTIVLNHVLEHVQSPTELLRELKRILHPKGTLLIGIPNIDSFFFKAMKGNWVSLDPPRHFYQFSPTTIELYATKLGFKLERIRFNSAALPFIAGLYSLARRILSSRRPFKETSLDNAFLQAIFSPFAIALNLLHWGDKIEVFMTHQESSPSDSSIVVARDLEGVLDIHAAPLRGEGVEGAADRKIANGST